MAHYNCCIPGCTNSYRNAPNLQYYRIPKDPHIRRKYVVLMRNETLKLDSTSTRICSVHFDGGEKLSRTHLPSIFPWTKPTAQRRERKRASFEDVQKIEQTKKRKTALAQLPQEANFKFEEQTENMNVNADTSTSVEMQTLLTGDQLNSLYNRMQTREQEIVKLKGEIQQLEKENNNIKEVNSKLQKEIESLKHALDNNRFDISKFKDKDDDIAFYTGFPDYNAFILCYKTVEQASSNINYGHKRTTTNGNVGRPRVLTKFQEFTLVMLRLRLGLFENDLAHRFLVSRSTVSKIVNAWIPFLRREFEPLIIIPPREVLQCYRPDSFKKLLPNVTVIVDCTEFEMERPSALDSQSTCFSSYKSRTTMKSLLGITVFDAMDKLDVDRLKYLYDVNKAKRYQIIGDNLDMYIKAHHTGNDSQNRSIHWFATNAIQDRVTFTSSTSIINQRKLNFEVENSEFLPSPEDNCHLLQDFIPLAARVLVDNLPDLRCLKKIVVRHIPHQYSGEMKKKSAQTEYNNVYSSGGRKPRDTSKKMLRHYPKWISARTSKWLDNERRPGNQENASRNCQTDPICRFKSTEKQSVGTEKTSDQGWMQTRPPASHPVSPQRKPSLQGEADTTKPQTPATPGPSMARRTSSRTVKPPAKFKDYLI